MLTYQFLSLAGLASAGLLSSRQNGYVLPQSGIASVTQFKVMSEFQGGTSCGVRQLASGQGYSIQEPGTGPGELYAAINQLAFGANPYQANNKHGGSGAACGLCYQLTPIDGQGTYLKDKATTFRIIDECPTDQGHCNQCSVGQTNGYGQTWHFDIASDAMNQPQYKRFFGNAEDGS
ncbi:MAG: hypothetical protein M1817_000919 [Caeruleum heppii]|nr:MAG: hypothetical protein M1817_000919 [Caeruleum heppii]